LQTAALKKAGCKKIFEDRGVSGAVAKRPSLTRCVNTLQAGDTLVVWKLDRLGRSLHDLITFLDDLKQRSIEFQSITEAINTGTPVGRVMWQIIGALAELERSMIIERTKAGVAAQGKRVIIFMKSKDKLVTR
jgi:DNA invertase Pin-like site-specific DNA recombinase